MSHSSKAVDPTRIENSIRMLKQHLDTADIQRC